jgi:hypothetical protein
MRCERVPRVAFLLPRLPSIRHDSGFRRRFGAGTRALKGARFSARGTAPEGASKPGETGSSGLKIILRARQAEFRLGEPMHFESSSRVCAMHPLRTLLGSAVLLSVLSSPGCLSVSALFNSKKVFDKETRKIVSGLAGLGDLFVVSPGVCAAGYYGIGSDPDRVWIRDGFVQCFLYFGWELLIVADALCAAMLMNWLWDENLTEDFGLHSPSKPAEWPPGLRTRGP